jgi:hypothetical protein
MKLLAITWTEVFYAIGDFFTWAFGGMRALGHGPNVIWGILIVSGIVYWTVRLSRYRKQAHRNSTLE